MVYLSIDVECVATGISHNAREVCSVAVVDAKEKVLLLKKVKPMSPVISYLTPMTGVRQGDLDDAENLSDVLGEVKALLGRDVVLVGQAIQIEIKWLELEQGKDYSHAIDLSEMFKAYNSHYRNYSFFTLSFVANTLISPGN